MADGGKQRRALTQASRRAPVVTTGERGPAEALHRALDMAGASEDAARAYTHGFHTYPAKLHPLTARRCLALLRPGKNELVVDPFCGSGTVLVEAVLAGARGIGVDANPLAAMIARAKTWGGPRKALVERARAISARAIEEGKAARRSGYRGGSGPALKELEEQFAPHVRREIATLAGLVAAEKDAPLREVLWTVLSSILVKVSNRTSDTAGRRVERRVGRGMAARLFGDRAEELARGLDLLWRDSPSGAVRPEVLVGDARALPAALAPGSVAAVVTSPPYAGTYDYLEHHALRLAVLGLDAAKFAQAEIGARRGFAADVASALATWERDLGKALGEIARVLRSGGRAVIVMGDSLAGRGPSAVPIFADNLLARLLPKARLEIVATASQDREPLGMAEKRAFSQHSKREHLVLVAKP